MAIITNALDFLQYDVVTKINIINESPITFPAITFCNLNGFSSDFATSLINSLNNSMRQLSNPDQLRQLVEIKASLLDDTEKKQLGLSIDNSLISCTFNYKACSIEDFHWYYSSTHGNCFRFNTGFNSNDEPLELKKANQPGFDSGLTIELFKGLSYNMITHINSGFNVFIENSTVYPLNYEGITVKPGILTKLIIYKQLKKKLPMPYNECVMMDELSSSVFYAEIARLNRTYRRQDCFRFCFQAFIIGKCGCYDPRN